MRLMQVSKGRSGRQVVAIDGGKAWIVAGYPTVYDLALAAIEEEDDDRRAGCVAPAAPVRPIPKSSSRPDACCRRSTIPIRRICMVTGTGLTHLGSAATRDSMHQKVTSGGRGDADRLDADVSHGPRGRQAEAGQDRRPAGVVLQGRRHLRRGARRAARLAGLRRGRRRGAGGRRHLCGRPGRHTVPDRLCAPQRILRPRHRAAELSAGSPIRSCGPARSDRNSCSASCRPTSAAPRASAAARRSSSSSRS